MLVTRVALILLAMLATGSLGVVFVGESWHYREHGKVIPATVRGIDTQQVRNGRSANASWNNVDYPVLSYTSSDGKTHECIYEDYYATWKISPKNSPKKGQEVKIMIDEHFPEACQYPDMSRFDESYLSWGLAIAVALGALMLALFIVIKNAIVGDRAARD